MTISISSAVVVPEGDDVEVKRLMPVANLRNFDPFVLWDHFDIAGGGFPNHPHRGFEAITYMLEGGMQHTDNLGNKGVVYAGGAQRFTAGKGLVHSEMPDGHAAGIQLWINLPKRLKGIEPNYQQADSIPSRDKDGVSIRVIVGEGGAVLLKTEVEYLDVSLAAGICWQRPIPDGFRGFVYVLEGSLLVEGENVAAASAAYIDGMSGLTIETSQATRLMWCFGRPHGEPIYQNGPFVD